MIGDLALICRHPLKGHGREELASVRLSAGQSLPWDRVWAVAHEGSKLEPEGGWSRPINFARAARAPELMALTSTLDEAAGRLTLRHPARGEISVTLGDEAEMAALVDWLQPLNPEGRLPTRLVTARQTLTDSAWPSVSLLSLSSLRALGEKMGQELSPHRFRGNLWVEGWEPWAEKSLIGQEVQIGATRLLVREEITRCNATRVNPSTGIPDAETLTTLRDDFGHQQLGLYCEVIEGGEIRLGDKVSV